MTELYPLVLAWMVSLAPQRDHSELAHAISLNASSEQEAALLTAVAFRESSLRNDAVGDGGHSVCAFQILGGPKSFLTDPNACTARAATMLRESARIDPKFPVSHYARGPKWNTEEARRISRDRTAIAARLIALKTKP